MLWDEFRRRLDAAFQDAGVRAAWVDVNDALLPTVELESLVLPYLGGDDPVFGTAFDGTLADLFDPAALARLRPDPDADVSIVYGCGAALVG